MNATDAKETKMATKTAKMHFQSPGTTIATSICPRTGVKHLTADPSAVTCTACLAEMKKRADAERFASYADDGDASDVASVSEMNPAV